MAGFDALLKKNVPHILEKIFFNLDYKSFLTCRKVSKKWRDLLTSKSFQLKEKTVYIEELRNHIKEALDTPLVTGDTWYLCDKDWFSQLQKYLGLSAMPNLGLSGYNSENADVGNPSAHPGQIDLSKLFQNDDPSAELKAGMTTDIDHTTLPESAWDKLVDIFGLTEGQNPVARKVIFGGLYVKHHSVEVYPMALRIVDMTNIGDVRRTKISRSANLSKLFKQSLPLHTRLQNSF